MSVQGKQYDCAIVGGGLAGLCLSVQLAGAGYRVVVFEKQHYPFHKVCGEYVSNECYGFLVRLGLKLDEWLLPQINRLVVSSEKGFLLQARLDLGGFGISRHRLDHELMLLARKHGVEVNEGTRVTAVEKGAITTTAGKFSARVCVGAFGKSNPHFARHETASSGFVGVKYHVKVNRPTDRIELHNFSGGYCGISRVEEDKWCLCYIAMASQLKKCGSIQDLQNTVLSRNPHLAQIFSTAEFISGTPSTVSNIRFAARRTSDEHLIYLGDAAGCISPFTGNGMSMSVYASATLSTLIHNYLSGAITSYELRTRYDAIWKSQFLRRIARGRQLQMLFGSRHLSDMALRAINPFERVKRKLIQSTHGVPF